MIDSVTVTGSQTLVGKSDNVPSDAVILDAAGTDVTAAYDIKYVNGTLEVYDDNDDEKIPDNLVVTKEDNSGNTYHVGDTIEWTIWIKNVYDEEKTLTVTEAEGMTIVGTVPETLAAGEEITITVQHVVTVEDVTAESVSNEVTVQIGDIEKKGDDEVETEQIEITITADSDSKLYDGTELTNEGYALTAGELAEGNSIDSVTVTGSQTLIGSSSNVPSDAVILDADGADVTAAYDITYVNGTLEVYGDNDDEEVDDNLVVTKTVDDTIFRLGQTVTFTITATNVYADARTITLSEIDGVTLAQSTFENVAGGETVETTATYTITEADIREGSFTNTVTATVGDLTKTAEAEAVTEAQRPSLVLRKTVSSDAASYTIGDQIRYRISVINNGNVTITGTITDELTGGSWDVDLAPGERVGFTTRYTVTVADAAAREVTNTAEAAVTDPEGNAVDVDPASVTTAIQPGTQPTPTPTPDDGSITVNGNNLTVTYDGQAHSVTGTTTTEGATILYSYDGGETWTTEKPSLTNVGTITFRVRATHPAYKRATTQTYRLTVNPAPVTVTVGTYAKAFGAADPTFGANVRGLVNGESDSLIQYTIGARNPGEAAGSYAIPVGGEELQGNYIVTYVPGTLTIAPPIPVPTSSLTVTKTVISAPADGEMYRTGETITYSITVTNDGEADQTNVVVTDPLTDDTWTVGYLAAGASQTFTATYVVTEADAAAGTVSNTATVTGTPADGTVPAPTITPGTAEVPVGPAPEPINEFVPYTIDPIPRPDNRYNPTPEPEEIVQETPMVQPTTAPAEGAWALVNLLCMIASIIIAVILLILYFAGKKKDEEDEEEGDDLAKAAAAAAEAAEDEEDEAKLKRKGIFRLLSIIPAVAALITFILTEDITQPMIMVDKWTILMVIFAVVSVILIFLSKKSTKDGEDEEGTSEG